MLGPSRDPLTIASCSTSTPDTRDDRAGEAAHMGDAGAERMMGPPHNPVVSISSSSIPNIRDSKDGEWQTLKTYQRRLLRSLLTNQNLLSRICVVIVVRSGARRLGVGGRPVNASSVVAKTTFL